MKDREKELIVEFQKVGITAFDEANEITRGNIFDSDIFKYIFSIDDVCEREKLILKLEEQAARLKITSNFKRALRQYEKIRSNSKQKIIKQNHNEIANTLIKDNNIALYENDICIYENGVYSQNERSINKKIIELVPDSNTYFRKEVCNYLMLTAQEKELRKESGIINFKNGLFKMDNKMLLVHTPDFFSINQINTNLNLQAEKVQAIDDVLDRLSSGKYKRRQTILEMIGYSMTTSVKLQKAFVLYGPTARNGKSTLINIITKLIGNENIGTVSFKDMNKNRFAASGIKGKLLNIGSEMTDEYIDDVEIFKKWITGDFLEIEEKFKSRQKISPYAKFIFSANELPVVADKTDGFYRRLQIIPLEYSFTDKEAQKFNFNKLVSKEALEYLARISLEAYLNKGDVFANSEESDKEVGKYKITSNSVLSFVNDEDCISSFIGNGEKVRFADEVYACYEKYCEANKYRPIGRNKFYKEIEKNKWIVPHMYKNKKTYTFEERM